MTVPIDPELFKRTAPAWNCVAYPNDGMHYVARNGDCQWCGMTREQIETEREERAAAEARMVNGQTRDEGYADEQADYQQADYEPGE